MAVKAMPDGYHRVTPYLVVPGVATRLDCLTQAFEAHELHRVPQPPLDEHAALAVLAWEPRDRGPGPRRAVAGIAGVLAIFFGLSFNRGGSASAVRYPADDAIYPGGHKRAHAEIVTFMETAVLPWARTFFVWRSKWSPRIRAAVSLSILPRSSVSKSNARW